MKLLPLFLDLRGKRVLVVGGGRVARAKVEALRGTGCALRVVSPAFSADFLAALRGFDVERHTRTFQPSDLDGVQLVLGATRDGEANARVAVEARARGIWVNAVDDAAACDALFPSVLRRGPFVAAVSTEGAFAGLSRALREALEDLVPDAIVPELEDLVEFRRTLRQAVPAAERRARILRGLLQRVRRDVLPSGARP